MIIFSSLLGDILNFFLILFSVVVLFIIGTASAMRYFDNEPVKKKELDE